MELQESKQILKDVYDDTKYNRKHLIESLLNYMDNAEEIKETTGISEQAIIHETFGGDE